MTTHLVNGARLHVQDRGSGTTVVLIHGGLGVGSEWNTVAERLTDQHRVVTFDARGHGRSDNPIDVLSYSQLADDVAALITALGLVAPTVVGWSDGGQVALELIVRHPAAAGALIVGGAYPDFDDSGLRSVHQRLIDEVRDEADPALDAIKALHANWPRLVEQTAIMWTTYPGIDRATIAAITSPVLVLAADQDELVSLALHLQLFELLQNAELAVIPGASHETPFATDRAPLLSALIADFTHRHTLPGPSRT